MKGIAISDSMIQTNYSTINRVQPFRNFFERPRSLTLSRPMLRAPKPELTAPFWSEEPLPPSGREAAIANYGFTDVLSVEDMVQDLGAWQPDYWIDYIGRLQHWSKELFGFLTSP